MSARLFKDDVIFVQRLLASSSLYAGRIDGIWGPRTEAAVGAFERKSDAIMRSLGGFDLRSEANIVSLNLPAQAAARQFMRKACGGKLSVRIISGTRSYAEQNALFRRGRYGNPGPRVTNARGGFSTHNFAYAWDIGLFEKGRYLKKAGPYDEIAERVANDELEWGGEWIAFKDRPHYQLKTGLSLKEVRVRFETGKPFLA